MILTRNYDLDVIPGGQPLLIRVSKNDTSSTLVFSLFTGKGILAVPVGANAVFRGAHGRASSAGVFSLDGGIPKVTVDLTADMTGTEGRIPFEIVLTSDTYTFVTATLYLDVRG